MSVSKMVFTVQTFVYAGLLSILTVLDAAQAQVDLPNFAMATFGHSTTIDNPYFPLVPGRVATFHEESIDPVTGETTPATIITEVLHDTRTVAGVVTRVVHDSVYEEGLLREDTYDWYAQDDQGNVWYMGENVSDFEYDAAGNVTSITHPGQWEAGVNSAKAGYIMPANRRMGNHYYQEFSAGIAVDDAQVTGTNVTFVVPHGAYNNNVLRTRDFSALEPQKYANKYYAPGVGPIAERGFTSGGKATALVDRNPDATLVPFDATNFVPGAAIDNRFFPVIAGKIYNYEGHQFDRATGESETLAFQETHTARTREILGVPAQIVRGIEYDGGLKAEDSEFYYAQDKNGNVWWLGEFSTKFKYDDAGNFIGTFDDSTWIAGVNGAKPGLYMPAGGAMLGPVYEMFAPRDGDIDTMSVLSKDEHVSTIFGELSGVAKVLEKSDFKPGFASNKYYAPGKGLVRVLEDFDAQGNPRTVLELTSVVPEPTALGWLPLAVLCGQIVRQRKSSRGC